MHNRIIAGLKFLCRDFSPCSFINWKVIAKIINCVKCVHNIYNSMCHANVLS